MNRKDAKVAKYIAEDIAVIESANQTGMSFNFVQTTSSPE